MFGALEYTVKSGDSLSLIAKKYGRPLTDWKKIYDLNKSIIGKNPDRIYPGQNLQIPVTWEGSPVRPSPLPVPSPSPILKASMNKWVLIAGVIGLAYYANKKKWF